MTPAGVARRKIAGSMVWNAIRANAVPMVALWLLVAAVVAAYGRVPAVAAALDALAAWQTASGWRAAFLNRFVLCGLLPGVFVLSLKALRPPRPLAVVLAQATFAGACGVVSGWMFELHACWFGAGTDAGTLLVKTAMYQFVWVVAFFMPVGAVVYFWIGRDFSFRRTRAEWPRHFVRELLVPNLLANWAVWVPLSFLVHLFPTPLQVQVTGAANAFLGLVLLTLGRRAATSRSARRTGV